MNVVVDYELLCCNIFVGVGFVVIEMGLFNSIGSCEIKVKIWLFNNGGFVEVVVKMLGGEVFYEGNVVIDGVLGMLVFIEFYFVVFVGYKFGGKLFFMGCLCDVVNGVEVMCIDCVVLIVIVVVFVFGKMVYELKVDFDVDLGFLSCVEVIVEW